MLLKKVQVALQAGKNSIKRLWVSVCLNRALIDPLYASSSLPNIHEQILPHRVSQILRDG